MAQTELRDRFLGLQKEMLVKLDRNRRMNGHPVTKGDVAELCWLDMLQEFLPKRYKTEKAFVLDSKGQCSEQIDIVIFDQQYSPFLFKEHGAIYIPAESVHAVFEVRPKLNKSVLEYAGKKVASVRKLLRTSIPIPHIDGGFYPAKVPFNILAGVLTLDSGWKEPFSSNFSKIIKSLPKENQLDIGCVLMSGGFNIEYPSDADPLIKISKSDDSLIFFFLKLLIRLQSQATVPAININAYLENLETTTD